MIYNISVLIYNLIISYFGFLFSVFIYVHSKIIFCLLFGDRTGIKSSYFFCRPTHFYDRGTAFLIPILIAIFSHSMAIGFFLHPPVNMNKIKNPKLFKLIYPFAGTIGVFSMILILLTVHTIFRPLIPFFETIKYPLDYFFLACILTCLFQLFPIYGTDFTLFLGNFFKNQNWYNSLVDRSYLLGTIPLLILLLIRTPLRMTIMSIYAHVEVLATSIASWI